MLTSPEKMHEIIVRDPDFLSGRSVQLFVTRMINGFGINWIRVDDIKGAVQGLAGRDGELMCATIFLQLVAQASQYDWAFFYMFSGLPERPTEVELKDTDRLIDADLTVRLVDDTFFYVYSKNGEIAEKILILYPQSEHRRIEIQNLRIPY